MECVLGTVYWYSVPVLDDHHHDTKYPSIPTSLSTSTTTLKNNSNKLGYSTVFKEPVAFFCLFF